MDRDEVIAVVAKTHVFERRSRHDRARDAEHYWQCCGQHIRETELRAATAALTAAEPFFAEQWRPIEEAPRDGQRYLLWSPKWTGTACGIWQNAWTVGYDLPPFLYQPTHFMPLPAPPVTKGEGEAA